MQNLKYICKCPLLFPRLETVQVKDCPELETLSLELNSGPCLESLSLRQCNKLVEIITVEESKMTNTDPQKDSFFPSLIRIILTGMQNLKYICKCPLLFPRLETVQVKDCPDPQRDSFFPSLIAIYLEGMQNLKCICKHPLLFPRLKKVWVEDCRELETLSFELNSGQYLEFLDLRKCNKLVEIITVEESKMTNADPQKEPFFPSLTKIILAGMQNLKCICKRPLLFPRLEKVWVEDCPELETLSLELNSGPCLELLFLCWCDKLVEIITFEESKMTNADPQKESFFP